jgi:hypothetical protein
MTPCRSIRTQITLSRRGRVFIPSTAGSTNQPVNLRPCLGRHAVFFCELGTSHPSSTPAWPKAKHNPNSLAEPQPDTPRLELPMEEGKCTPFLSETPLITPKAVSFACTISQRPVACIISSYCKYKFALPCRAACACSSHPNPSHAQFTHSRCPAVFPGCTVCLCK